MLDKDLKSLITVMILSFSDKNKGVLCWGGGGGGGGGGVKRQTPEQGQGFEPFLHPCEVSLSKTL